MRILCLSNMYPSPEAPDYGAFVRDMCDALEMRGHEVDRVVIATRAAGHYATVYSQIDDHVESLRVVTPSGTLESFRLPGSGAGPSPDR